MSLEIKIKKEFDNNKYLAEYKLENETWEKKIDLNELKVEIKSNVNKLSFDTPVSFYSIDIDIAEDNKEFDVNLSKWKYDDRDKSFYEIETRTCKKKNTAIEIIEDWYSQYGNTILNDKVDIYNEIKNIELKERKKSLDEIIKEASSQCNGINKKERNSKELER